MNRYINAEWLLGVAELSKGVIDVDDVYNAPTIEIPTWIPCSERLPNKGEIVLITNGKGHVRCGQFRSVDYVKDGITHWQWKGNTSETVLAWLPLPTAYKGEDDGSC